MGMYNLVLSLYYYLTIVKSVKRRGVMLVVVTVTGGS